MKLKIFISEVLTLLVCCTFFYCSVDTDLFSFSNYIKEEDRLCKPDTRVYIPGFPINRFEKQVVEYEKSNKPEKLKNRILFYGSSTMVFWNPTLVQNFDGLPVLGHGFGGSTFPEMTYYASRLVLKYEPKILVIYCENDLFNTPAKSVKQVNDDVCEFITRINKSLPNTKIVYLAMKHSVGRDFGWKKMNEVNLYVKNMSNTNNTLTYVDLNSELMNKQGVPDSSNFTNDYVHLNTNAYTKWSAKLKPILSNLYNQ